MSLLKQSEDIQLYIFTFLGLASHFNLQETCRQLNTTGKDNRAWKKYLKFGGVNVNKMLEHIIAAKLPVYDISMHCSNGNCNHAISIDTQLLKQLTTVEVLDLTHCGSLQDKDLKDIGTLPALRSLDLSHCGKITNAGMEYLKELSNLQVLDLTDCEIGDNGIYHLQDMITLESLTLPFISRANKDNEITDVGMSYLKKLTNMKYLKIGDCENITNVGLSSISEFIRLETLILGGVYCNITNDGLVHLKKMTRLQVLKLPHIKLSDVGLSHLKGFTAMRVLSFPSMKDCTDKGLVYLKRMTQLQGIYMGYNVNITDDGLVNFSEMTYLKSLTFNYFKEIIGSGLAYLKDCPLSYLSLSVNRDENLKYLSQFSTLRYLSVNGKITDVGAAHIAQAVSLKHLDIRDTRITDAGVGHMRTLVDLEMIMLPKQITSASNEHLSHMRKLRQVYRNGDEIYDDY